MKLLFSNEALRAKIASDPADEPMAGAFPDPIDLLRVRLQAMMDAYERRVRSDCRSPADLAAKPWECREYLAAEEALRATLGASPSAGAVPE